MADIADFANDLVQERIDQLLACRRAAPVACSALECDDCGSGIPVARQLAAPGCVRCIYCQGVAERLGVVNGR